MTEKAAHSTQAKGAGARKKTLSTLQGRLRVGTALAGMMLPLGMPGLALAADECGAPIGGVVTCSASGNSYSGGIAYTGVTSFTLSPDAVVETSGSPAIGIVGSGGPGTLDIDLQGRVVSTGAMGTGVSVDTTPAATTVNVNSITSAGKGLRISGDTGSIDVTAGTIESGQGGIEVTSYDAAISIDAHSISSGDDAIYAVIGAGTGAVKVYSDGLLSTTGGNSMGVLASGYGDVDIDVNTVTTVGDYSDGLQADAAGSGGTVSVDAVSVSTKGEGSKAIYAASIDGKMDINVRDASTEGDNATALHLISGSGDINLVSTGALTTLGKESSAIDAFTSVGAIDLNVHTISTLGEDSDGIEALTDSGAINIKVNAITTLGEDGDGIDAETGSGAIDIDVGTITTAGDGADAIKARSTDGTITVNARGELSTAGHFSSGVDVETDGDVEITVNDINTAGEGSDAVVASSGSGKLTVTANGAITTKDKSSRGIAASSDSGDVEVTAVNIDTARDNGHGIEAYSNTGKVKIVDNGKIVVRGENAHGIVAAGGGGTSVVADSVSVSGYRADGIKLSGEGGIDLKIRDLLVEGERSDGIVVQPNSGPVRIDADNVRVTGDDSDGIIAEVASGAVDVNVGNVHASNGRAISATTDAGDTTLRIAGKVQGVADQVVYAKSTGDTRIDILANGEVSSFDGDRVAIEARGTNVVINNAGLVSATTVPTIISDDGTTRLVNSGTVIGSVSFGEGDDLITNSGTFNLIGTSEFWDGNDVFANTGTVGLLGNATLTNLERFENAGRVTMANNRAGDVLTISGDYVGTNGRLVLDVDTGAVDTNDKLVIGGAASGKTVVGLNWLRGGTLLPGRTMTLVDAKGGSSANAFVLSPDAVDAGFSRYAISHDGAEDNFNIVASEGRGLFQTLNISAGAQALWRQSADAWATRTMAQRDPARDAHEPDRIWAQFYGSAEQRDQNFAARSGDFDISYRQKHAGGQVGLDLGEIGGVTYGLTGGYLASALKFAGREDRTDYDAFSMGAYAQGEWDGYFVNALAKYDVIGARINSATAGFTETLDGRAYGLQVEAGTRFGDAGFFLEPVASLAYSRTDLDTLSALGATVDFAQSDSLRGKAGARIGGTSDIGGSIATFYLGAHLVNEFEGDGGVRFDTGTSTTVLVNDPAGTYGQFQLGATLVSKAGLTGFAEATATMGRGYQNYGGRLGLRLAF